MLDILITLAIPFAATASYKSHRKVSIAILSAIFAGPYLIYWILAHNKDLKDRPLFTHNTSTKEKRIFKILMFGPAALLSLVLLSYKLQINNNELTLILAILGLISIAGIIIGVPLSIYKLNKIKSIKN